VITFALEKFDAAYAEMYPLLEQHYREISTHVLHGVELKPQVQAYRQYEREGRLSLVVGRENGAIIAYLYAFIGPGLHYSDCLTAIVDIYYVAPGMRGFMHGIKLFNFAKAEWKRRGVQRAAAGAKLAHDASPLLKRVGFAPVEIMHELWF
jgi:GNAT superfamily N-acetyltransferase